MTVAGLLVYRAAEDVSAKVRIVHVWEIRIMLDEVRMMFVVSVKLLWMVLVRKEDFAEGMTAGRNE